VYWGEGVKRIGRGTEKLRRALGQEHHDGGSNIERESEMATGKRGSEEKQWCSPVDEDIVTQGEHQRGTEKKRK